LGWLRSKIAEKTKIWLELSFASKLS
jgi:hypothetical protein